MKVALFYYGNTYTQGGTGHVLNSLYRSFKNSNHILYFFNPYYKGKYVFKLMKYQEYKFFNLLSIFRNKIKLKLFLFSIFKFIIDNKSKSSDKIKMILYLLIKPSILINTFNNLLHIYPILRKLDVDIILGGATSGEILVLIYIISRIFNKKLCSLTYGNDFLVKSSLSLKSYYIRNLDLIFLGTNTMKEIFKKVHPLNRTLLKVIPYGLRFEDYEVKETKEQLRKEFMISSDKFVLLSVGRHVSRKNFDLVIRVIQNLKEIPNIDILYFLIGQGEVTLKLKKLTKDLNLTNKIKFLGIVSRELRNKYYKLSDLFLMPSSTEPESIEGFGIVFLEANYFKCPVIGTYSGGISEAIINGETGFLIKENDMIDLTEKILFMYNNKEECSSMGLKGYKRVIKDFNWEFIIDEYIKTFNQILN